MTKIIKKLGKTILFLLVIPVFVFFLILSLPFMEDED